MEENKQLNGREDCLKSEILSLDPLLRLFFLNKLAACYLAKYLCVNELRK